MLQQQHFIYIAPFITSIPGQFTEEKKKRESYTKAKSNSKQSPSCSCAALQVNPPVTYTGNLRNGFKNMY